MPRADISDILLENPFGMLCCASVVSAVAMVNENNTMLSIPSPCGIIQGISTQAQGEKNISN